MKYNSNYHNRFTNLRMQSGNNKTVVFTPTSRLGVYNGQEITVADAIDCIEKMIQLIKAYFNVDQDKYAKAIRLLKVFELRLRNQNVSAPRKESLHLLVDVIHEVRDRQARCDEERQENDRIASKLDFLIDILVNESGS